MSLTKKDREEIRGMIEDGVRAQLREFLGQAVANPQTAGSLPGERFCSNYAALKAATGLSIGMLQAIKRASRGAPDSPFRGRGAFPSVVKTWLANRPDFAPAAQRMSNS